MQFPGPTHHGKEIEFAVGSIIHLFVQAMKEAGVEEDWRESIVRHFHDLAVDNEARIRRETEKLGRIKRI